MPYLPISFLQSFTRSVRYRSTASVAIENTTNNMIHFVDIPVIANNFGRKMIHKIQPVRHPPQTTPRKILTGLQILNRMMNPTIRSNIVAAVEISVVFTPNVLPNTTSAPTISTSVSLPAMPSGIHWSGNVPVFFLYLAGTPGRIQVLRS